MAIEALKGFKGVGFGFRVWGFRGFIGLGVQTLGAPGCRTYGA